MEREAKEAIVKFLESLVLTVESLEGDVVNATYSYSAELSTQLKALDRTLEQIVTNREEKLNI